MRISDVISDVCSSDLQSAALHFSRAWRINMSCNVLSSAWPMWSEPVTLGGGITIVKGSASGRSGRNAPELSQCGYQRASMTAGLKVLSSWPVSSVMRSEEHTSELQSLMRISYAVFCLTKNKENDTN